MLRCIFVAKMLIENIASISQFFFLNNEHTIFNQPLSQRILYPVRGIGTWRAATGNAGGNLHILTARSLHSHVRKGKINRRKWIE